MKYLQAIKPKETVKNQFRLKEVSLHCTIDSFWMVLFNKVYDLTDFIKDHPGSLLKIPLINF